MAEDAKRMDQYSYAATSNLVLSSNKSRPRDATKGEVQSLWGKTAGTRMGDAVRSDGPISNKKRKKDDDKKKDPNPNTTKNDDITVSPALLQHLREILGHQLPYETLKSAHDEVLEICLDADASPSSLKPSVSSVLGSPLTPDTWHSIKRAADSMRGRYTLLRDRNVAASDDGQDMNEDGVAVVFEDED
eukprot:CAMPEP_0197554742 /NCGR_PEP_ID=MMETSP1320-20131121/11939_1 /TAXON_ID=91990 /ORGANISM="Bolidomonas sp., Strain RCC2347" /LENGTH=188 /DNA_ID=CAMNT_0043115661 /DNA_START=143 /DNA_END=706 /DNA_ORIENTATION=+